MRHKVAFRKLGRTMEHRKSLRRSLAQSLFEHGQVRTTLQKAKDLQPFAEKLITLAKRTRQGSLKARQRLQHLLAERFFVTSEHQEDYDNLSQAQRRAVRQSRSGRRYRTGQARGSLPFTTQAVSHKLISDIAERFEDRQGGYTRLIRLATTRIGDAGEQAIVQLLGEEDKPGSVPKPGKSRRRRKADRRYGLVVKLTKEAGAVAAPVAEAPAEAEDTGDAEPAEDAAETKEE